MPQPLKTKAESVTLRDVIACICSSDDEPSIESWLLENANPRLAVEATEEGRNATRTAAPTRRTLP